MEDHALEHGTANQGNARHGTDGHGTAQHNALKRITFYFDVISPYAYLAFERLPQALMGHSVVVSYRPILFAALLNAHGQLGPAEVPPKREWTYRQVAWLARQQGTDLQPPMAHPFNPLGLLRLALACGSGDGSAVSGPNRYACETVFRHVWQSGGQDAADPARLAVLTEQLAPVRDPYSEAVKEQLKTQTAAALALGVFGVPTLVVDDKLFWGLDALPMLAAYVGGDPWFDGPQWQGAGSLPTGQTRKR